MAFGIGTGLFFAYLPFIKINKLPLTTYRCESGGIFKRVAKRLGCRVLFEQRTPGYFTLSVPKDKGLFETLRAFSDLDEVAFAEPSETGLDDLLVESTAEPPVQVTEPEDSEPLVVPELPITEFGELTGFEEELRLPELPEVLYEEEDDTLALPSDTHFGKLWGLHNTGQMVNGTAGLFADLFKSLD